MDKRILDGLKALGFTQFTHPQKEAIPHILNGESVLIVAPTGFGKTEAALLPLFEFIITKKPDPVHVLYITPLKALNRDLLGRMNFWSKNLGIKIAVRHGDTPQSERRAQVREPPQILITTPETFQGLLTAGKKLVEKVKWVVVDEIHELLEGKRGYQLAVGLERLKKITKFTRIGLSATVREPKLAADFLRGSDAWPKVISGSELKKLSIIVDSPKPSKPDFEFAVQNSLDPTVSAAIRKISSLEKSVLVFTNTREGAELLGSELNLLVPTKVHHSSLSKKTRLDAEQEFKAGKLKALVATSSMELGIDIGSIDTVVQYTSPRQVTALIQRVGRSGHSWEREGKGMIFAAHPEDVLESAVIAKAGMEGRLEMPVLEQDPLDVLAHQIVGMLMSGIQLDEAYNIVRGAQPYRNLEKKEFDWVIEFMRTIRLLTMTSKPRGFTYYYSNLSTIPDSRKYDAVNMVDGSRFAVLDEEFISTLDPGAVFICAGKSWQVVDIDPENERVLVEPASRAHSAPVWVGELIPVSKEVAQEAIKVKREILNKGRAEAVDYLVKQYPLTQDAAESVVDWVKKMEWVEPGIEVFKNFVFIHTPLGSNINQALGKLLAGFFSLRTGASVGMKSDQYRVMLEFPSPTDPKFVQEVLNSIDPQHIEANLTTIMLHTPLYRLRFIHVARRFGVISRDSHIGEFGVKRLMESLRNTPIEHEALKEIFTEKLDVNGLVQSIGELKNLPVYNGPSPMAIRVLENYAPELIGIKPESEILRLMKKRLEKKHFQLKCLYCKKWGGSATVLTAPEKCPNCGAKMIGVVPRMERKDYTSKSANLYLSYGKKTLLVLAGHGVGPTVAAKILARAKDETSLLKSILAAEKLYARTKRFWK